MSGIDEKEGYIPMRKRDRIKNRLKRMTENDILSAMKETLDNAYVVFKGKLGDYGVDTYKTAGVIGILMRMNEKFNRMDTLLKKKGNPNFESIHDNLQDIFVLAAAASAMLKKELGDIEEIQEQYRSIYGEADVEGKDDGET